jgi:hypothetical protein
MTLEIILFFLTTHGADLVYGEQLNASTECTTVFA